MDDSAVVPLEDIQVDDCLNDFEKPVSILDRKTKSLRKNVFQLVKVQWLHCKGSEWMWDPVEEMMEHYPGLFETADFKEGV